MSPPATGRAASRIGRRIAGALYVAIGIWVIVAGFVSAIPQIFWPAEAHGIAPARTSDCGGELRGLHDDLLRDAAERVREADDDEERAQAFLAEWDERYRALEAPCGEHAGYAPLARLRYRVEEHLLVFLADEAALSAETLSAIEIHE